MKRQTKRRMRQTLKADIVNIARHVANAMGMGPTLVAVRIGPTPTPPFFLEGPIFKTSRLVLTLASFEISPFHPITKRVDMSQHIEPLLQELDRLRAHCPRLGEMMALSTRLHFELRGEEQTTNHSLAVILFELLGHLETVARKSTRGLNQAKRRSDQPPPLANMLTSTDKMLLVNSDPQAYSAASLTTKTNIYAVA